MTNNVLSEDDLFSGLFDAIAKGDASAVNKLMAAEVEETSPAQEEPAPVDTNTTQEPTATADTDDDTTVAGNKQEATPADDWRTKLPAEIKDHVLGEFNQLTSEFQRLEQYRRSNEGRVSALNRKIEELETAKQQLASKPSPPVEKVEPARFAKEEEDPILEQLRDADPALYQALSVIRKRDEERFSKALNETVNKVTEQFNAAVTPLHKKQQDDYIANQVKIVYDTVPEIEKVMASDGWKAFYREASPTVRQLLDSPHADEFLTGVDAFTMYLYRNTPPDQMPGNYQATNGSQSAADRVQETRSRRLAASTPTNRAAAASPAQELDEAQYLERAFQQIYSANKV